MGLETGFSGHGFFPLTDKPSIQLAQEKELNR
jgi:hypothetical protein